MPCPKELFGAQSESHPQVLFAILRQQHDNLSLKARRWKCSLRIDYLKQVLGF